MGQEAQRKAEADLAASMQKARAKFERAMRVEQERHVAKMKQIAAEYELAKNAAKAAYRAAEDAAFAA